MRRLPLVLVLAVLLAVAATTGCKDNETVCTASRNCIDRDGTFGLCVRMRCAFLDDACVSEYRWDDSAGDLAGMCVDGTLVPDAAPRDARAAAAKDAP